MTHMLNHRLVLQDLTVQEKNIAVLGAPCQPAVIFAGPLFVGLKC